MSTQHAPVDTPAKPAPRRREVFDYDRIASSMTARTIEQLLDKTTDPALFIDNEGIIVGSSEKLCQVFGRSPEDLANRLWYEAIVPPDKQEEARDFVSSVLTGQADPATTWTCRLTTDEDRYVTITWHCVPPPEDAGDKGLAVLHGRGVLSDSDQVRHHLHELQVKYQGIVDNIATGVAIISPSMQILKLNQQMQEWFPHINAVDKPLCYRSFNNPPLNKTCPWCPVRKTLADGQVHEAITQTPAGDGKIRNYRIIASPLTDEDGSVVAAIEMVDDITDQLRAEEAIRQSEEQFRTVVNASMDAIIACDKRGRISVFNPAAEKMFGWKRDEAVGQPLEILLPTELTEEHRKTVSSYLATGKPDRAIGRQREMEARREDGSLFPIEMTLSAATVSGQRSAVAIIRDITNRREAQDQLHELATQYSTMMDTVPALVYVKDTQGRYVAVNQAFRSFLNRSDGEILGRTDQELLQPEEAATNIAGDEEVIAGGEKIERPPERTVDEGGAERWMSTTKVPLFDTNGEVTGLVGLVQDVTEAHQSREQLIQADKLAAIGTLAAGVAHEINNPIGFISSNLNTMGKYLSKINGMISDSSCEDTRALTDMLEDFSDAVEESIEGSERVKRIVADLKSFSRVDRSEAEHASINDGINSTLNIVWNELKYKCKVEKELGDLPDLYCRPNQLNQVFMNILINAGHAIDKDRGTIRIRTWAEDDVIYVSIRDNGKGIQASNLNKVFEPFYTTKDVGKGTGLGLSLAYDIVAKHGGNIEVDSKVGEGTEFVVSLPVGGLKDD